MPQISTATFYEKHSIVRFHKYALSLSGHIESTLLSAAANRALQLDDKDRYRMRIEKKQPKVSNKKGKAKFIYAALAQSVPIDLSEYREIS